MDSFEIIRCITKAMKKAGVKKGDTSHDTIDRITSTAKRALKSQESSFESKKYIRFFKSGNRWGVELYWREDAA